MCPIFGSENVYIVPCFHVLACDLRQFYSRHEEGRATCCFAICVGRFRGEMSITQYDGLQSRLKGFVSQLLDADMIPFVLELKSLEVNRSRIWKFVLDIN